MTLKEIFSNLEEANFDLLIQVCVDNNDITLYEGNAYEIEEEDYDEMELDVDGSAKLRVYHTPSLYSDWTVGAIFNYRPDNRADQYKDFYMIAALNYEF